MNYKDKGREIERIANKNFTRGNDNFKPSSVNYTENDKLKARVITLLGTIRIMEEKKFPQAEIDAGIEANAKRLGYTVDEYMQTIDMYYNPKPEVNPNPDPEKEFVWEILGTAGLINKQQRDGLSISNDEILKYKERSANKLGIDLDEYNEKLDMVLNPQPETNPEISDEVREPFV
jgi:hypothetical protein